MKDNLLRMEPVKKTVNERLRENENITRDRVRKIEEHLVIMGEYLAQTQDFFKLPLWKRLKWVFFGFFFEERALRKAEQAAKRTQNKGEDNDR